ncbi:uncharacterized protein LOC142319398 isoform X2 [Lycorma delicatula]
MYKINENFNFINYFGDRFNALKEGIDSLRIPHNNMNTIFFIGNTGSGKTTLVQILGSDNSKLYSKSAYKGTNDFIIVDDYMGKIGNDTVNSQTLYTELLVDKETGFVLCDNPGFRDTRSPIHEIIAMYSMKKVLKYTKNIKIVIVSAHTSLKVGMYRDDFTNLLKHVTDFLYDVDKYKNSLYLISTKAENVFSYNISDDKNIKQDESVYDSMELPQYKDKIASSYSDYDEYVNKNKNDYDSEKRKINLVSDYSIINDIVYFLKEVRFSLNKKSKDFKSLKNKDYLNQKSIKIINNLLKKGDDNSYEKIKILRKPLEEGPLSEINIIQSEKNSIKSMLLTPDNFVTVDEDDFGFALSDNAFLYLHNFFQRMNSYIIDLSNVLSIYIMNYYTNIINSNTDINEVFNILLDMKKNIKTLSNQISLSKNPAEYAKVMDEYSKQHKLQLDCLNSFKNIYTVNEYLIQLEDLIPDSIKYTPLTWSISMAKFSDYINNKIEQFKFLQNTIEVLSRYTVQKNRKSYYGGIIGNNEDGSTIDETNLQTFLETYNLNFPYLKADEVLFEKLNSLIDITLKHRYKFRCHDSDLVIIDYFILLSELREGLLKTCSSATRIVVLAVHTIFIDKDLIWNWFRGRDITIIAPIWEVIGSRKINLDGMSGGVALPKADFGEIGKNGRNGNPGGNFAGIGMIFKNGENLMISASGGEGQNGQEGGDGLDGKNGSNGSESNKEYLDDNVMQVGIFKFKEKIYLSRGSNGLSGGDSGAGGKGGRGGNAGSILIHNIGNEEDKISTLVENGKPGLNGKDGIPGKGGVRGCDQITKKKDFQFSIIKFESNSENELVNCGNRSEDGIVKKSNRSENEHTDIETNNDSPLCIHIMNFQKYYLEKYHSLLTDGIPKIFINKIKATKY